MESLEIVKKLIDKGSCFSPAYGNRLASHLPMALLALSYMGASEKQMNAFYDNYVLKLEKFKTGLTETKITNVCDYLGDRSKLQDYIAFFNEEIKLLGRDALLTKYLPVLWPGLAASAFHALIRLAYAVEAGIDSEVAQSLAYFASEYQPFDLKEEVVNLNFEDLLKKINPITINYEFPKGIIVDRMNEVDKLLVNFSESTNLKNVSLSEITELCLKLYLNHPNFTILHTITGSHAIRLLLPYLEDKKFAVKYALQAVVLALLSIGIKFNFEKVEKKFEDVSIEDLKSGASNTSDDTSSNLFILVLKSMNITKILIISMLLK